MDEAKAIDSHCGRRIGERGVFFMDSTNRMPLPCRIFLVAASHTRLIIQRE